MNRARAIGFAFALWCAASVLKADLGTSTNNVILINDTGLAIVRVQIDERTLEHVSGPSDRIFITVTPQKHYLKLFFKGGAQIEWPAFDFAGIHQITFQRIKNRINAHFEFWRARS